MYIQNEKRFINKFKKNKIDYNIMIEDTPSGGLVNDDIFKIYRKSYL